MPTTGFATCFLTQFCPWYVLISMLCNVMAILKQEITSSWDQLNAWAYIMYAWYMCEKERDSRKRQEKEAGELPAWVFIILKYTKMSLGEKRSCVSFEELISLSHLNVCSVSDSVWKPQFHTFLTAPLMSTDNVQRLPGSEASNNGGRVSGGWLRWSWLSFIIWPLSS